MAPYADQNHLNAWRGKVGDLEFHLNGWLAFRFLTDDTRETEMGPHQVFLTTLMEQTHREGKKTWWIMISDYTVLKGLSQKDNKEFNGSKPLKKKKVKKKVWTYGKRFDTPNENILFGYVADASHGCFKLWGIGVGRDGNYYFDVVGRRASLELRTGLDHVLDARVSMSLNNRLDPNKRFHLFLCE